MKNDRYGRPESDKKIRLHPKTSVSLQLGLRIGNPGYNKILVSGKFRDLIRISTKSFDFVSATRITILSWRIGTFPQVHRRPVQEVSTSVRARRHVDVPLPPQTLLLRPAVRAQLLDVLPQGGEELAWVHDRPARQPLACFVRLTHDAVLGTNRKCNVFLLFCRPPR